MNHFHEKNMTWWYVEGSHGDCQIENYWKTVSGMQPQVVNVRDQ